MISTRALDSRGNFIDDPIFFGGLVAGADLSRLGLMIEGLTPIFSSGHCGDLRQTPELEQIEQR